MARTVFSILAGLLVAASVVGCLPVELADEEFTDALPTENDLVVKIGSQDFEKVSPESALSVFGELDPFVEPACSDELCVEVEDEEEWYVSGTVYELTRSAKWHVNGGLVVTMGWIWAIVTSPYPEQTATGYMWGPWHESLARIEFRFLMDKVRAGYFTFQLEGRNINDPLGEWSTIVDGAIDAGDLPHASEGTVVLDYDAIHAIDSSHPTPEAGRVTYAFDVRDYPYTVEAQFEGFQPLVGETIDATYSYVRLGAGMSGSLDFEVGSDIWPLDTPDGTAETLTVSSDWTSSGEGKGRATVSEGTLSLDGSNVDEVVLGECWAGSDCLFYQTYYATDVDYNDGTDDAVIPGCGSELSCPVII